METSKQLKIQISFASYLFSKAMIEAQVLMSTVRVNVVSIQSQTTSTVTMTI